MGDYLEDIIEESLIILGQSSKNYGKIWEENDYDCLIKESLNIFYFLSEICVNIRRNSKLEKENHEKLIDCLEFLRKNSIYYNKNFLEQSSIVINKIYFEILKFSTKKSFHYLLRKIEKTKLNLISIDKSSILSKILECINNKKLLFFFIKNHFFHSKYFSLSEKKHIYLIIAKLIFFVYKCKIVSKKNYLKLIDVLMDKKIKPKLTKLKKRKRFNINYSRYFRKKIISSNMNILVTTKEQNDERQAKKVKNTSVNNFNDYKRKFYKSLYQEESLYYKVKFYKNKKITRMNDKSIKCDFKIKKECNDENIPPNLQITNSSKDLTKNNYNKYDNSKNTSILFHLCTPIKNYVSTGIHYDRCDEIYHEYINLKLLELHNPQLITTNISLFESNILLPLYQKIILTTQKKKHLFYYVYAKYRNILTNFIIKETNIPFRIEPYGSYSNNFLLDVGDIDMCIIPNSDDYLRGFGPILEKLNEYLVKNGIAETQAYFRNNRYLLLKIVDKETNFNIDLTVHSLLPILNTKLIRLYSLFDQRFHIIGIYLKYWSKLNQVQGTSNCFLSSYALILMLIYFLQNITEPRVLPNLQKIDEKEIIYEYKYIGKIMKVNINFMDDLFKAREHLFKINNNMNNTESVTSLLVKFFEFFSYYFDSLHMKISINKDIEETFKELKDNYAFSIDDPFDLNHNPGKSMYINSLTHEAFIKSMRLEINYILSGEYIRRLESSHTKDDN